MGPLAPGNAKRLCIAIVFALLFTWRGAGSLFAVVDEIASVERSDWKQALTATQDERIRRGLAFWEKRYGFEVGREASLFSALRQEVPPEGEIWFVTAREPKAMSAWSHLRVLLHPRRFEWTPAIPADWKESTSGLHADFFILEYGGTSGRLDDSFEAVARGDDYVLWRFVGGGG